MKRLIKGGLHRLYLWLERREMSHKVEMMNWSRRKYEHHKEQTVYYFKIYQAYKKEVIV